MSMNTVLGLAAVAWLLLATATAERASAMNKAAVSVSLLPSDCTRVTAAIK